MNITTYKNHNFTPYHHPELGEMLSNKDVAFGYSIAQKTINDHRANHQDELIEGVHWLRVEVQTKGGKQRVIHWTLDGIHMLGFFIKSNEAKHFRKWASKLITEMRKGYTTKQTSHHKIAGYKSQIAQHNKKIDALIKENRQLQARVIQLQDPMAIASTVVRALQAQEQHKNLTKLYEKTLNENETLKQKMKQQLSLIVSQIDKEILTRFEESLEVTSRSLELQSLK